MIKNYLLANLRMLWKNRSHALINMLGLAMGITCSILIFLIIRFELSYDTYHPDADRIYRVVTEFYREQPSGYTAGVTYPLVPAMRKDFPDPQYVTIVDCNMNDPVVSITHKDGKVDRFKEKHAAFFDPEYFKIFQYDWIEGDTGALRQEKTVVLAESIAKKYFGSAAAAIHQVINFNSQFDVTVTGVVADPPLNSDFPFQVFFSFRLGADKRGWDNWGSSSSSVNCYVKLNPGATEQGLEDKMKGWHVKYFTSGDEQEDAKYRTYSLQPLSDIHFDTRYGSYGGRVVSRPTLITLGLIGTLLLLTACINFINLNTVLIISRSKEAGIRKVMGSSRSQLIFQFLGETLLITLIALLLSTGLVEIALLELTPVLGYRLSFHPFSDPATLLFLLMLPVLVTLLAGLYPGFSLSRFQPVKALKNKISGSPGQGLSLRRSLIVFQLMISQALVVCTIITVQQLNHFMSQPLGLDSRAVLEFEIPEGNAALKHSLMERLRQVPGVESVALSNTGSTSSNNWGGGFEAQVNDKEVKKDGAQVKFVTSDYVKTYHLTLLHGEDLQDSDTATRFLVNEKFAHLLGFANSEDAIGTPVNLWGRKAQIKGIVKDYNTQSLHSAIEPTIISTDLNASSVAAVRINTTNLKTTVAAVQKTWEDLYPKYVFESQFLDDTIAQFYKAEQRSSYLIGLFAGVAIVIGCIGLFGLVSFMARMRTKEVGIRKTLGASVLQVVGLFSKEFMILIGISFLLSAPMAWYFMEQWLENFVYRIHPDAFTFLLGALVTLLIVLGTVGIKSYRAAVANPVDALRDE